MFNFIKPETDADTDADADEKVTEISLPVP